MALKRLLLVFSLALLPLIVLTIPALSGGESARAAGTSAVSIGDNGVTPEVAHAWPGNFVTFTNNTDSTQRLVSLQGPQAFDTGDIAPNGSVAVVFVVAGQYTYQSTTNPSIVGVVLVEKDGVNLGRLEVEKVVVRGADDFSPFGFEICIQGPSYPTGGEAGACQLVAATGGTVAWDDVITGEYTVSETDPGPTWVVTQDATNVQVDRRETSRVTITNTAALIKVTKSVDWGGATAADISFTVCVTGPSYPTTATAGSCQDISDGETAMWRVAPGDYVVSEIANPAFEGTVAPHSLSVAGGETASSTVSNRLVVFGGLEVTKKVDWWAATFDGSQTFEVCIKGPSFPVGNETGACYTYGANGGMFIWENLIPGTYAISETDPGPVWAVDIAPSSADVKDSELTWVTVTNTNKSGAPGPPNTGSGLAPATSGAGEFAAVLGVTLAALGLTYGLRRRA